MARVQLRKSLVSSHTAQAIFSTLSNLPAAPSWLPNCTGIEVLDDVSVAAGSRLRYSFREFGYEGTLPCSVVAFMAGQRVAIAFSDPRVEARFDFVIAQEGGATTIVHTVELVPKSHALRMLAGVIRRSLSGRMDAALRGIEHATGQRGT